ncbi:MAG TPA: hypothetical protein VFM14_04550, partial [Gemmatimonadales bacterium]|nr:hypothetical protein [Gemmatimonadales bacterium]
AGYAARARHALASEATLNVVADLEEQRNTFDATAYPMALVLTRRRASETHRVRTSLSLGEPARTRQAGLGGGAPWVLTATDEMLCAGAQAPRLGDRFTPHLGVKTGANALFLDPPPSVEPALVRVSIRGRDVRPFAAIAGPRLLWPCDESGRPLARLPAGARAHLAPLLPRLRARVDYGGGPPWTLFRTEAASAEHRVVWADLARRLTALALTGPSDRNRIPLNTCYVLAMPDGESACRLAAWLNCSWIRAAARLGATVASGGYARFCAARIEALPLPDTVLADATLGELARAGAAGSSVQAELDHATARHLALTPAARHALAGVAGVADDRR